MKKTLFTLTALIVTTALFAQIEQGAMFLGGEINYYSGKTTVESGGNTSETTKGKFAIEPSFGYFLTDEWALGIGLGISSEVAITPVGQNANGDDVNDEKTEVITGAEVFARYYKGLNEKAFFFGELSLGFGSGTSKETKYSGPNNSVKTETEDDVSTFRFGITPGFNYFISDKFAAELSFGFLGYNSISYKLKDGDYKETDTELGVDLNLNTLRLGLKYFF